MVNTRREALHAVYAHQAGLSSQFIAFYSSQFKDEPCSSYVAFGRTIEGRTTSRFFITGVDTGEGIQFHISAIFFPISENLQTQIGYFRYPQGS